jgi:hypothetical protein
MFLSLHCSALSQTKNDITGGLFEIYTKVISSNTTDSAKFEMFAESTVWKKIPDNPDICTLTDKFNDEAFY